MVILATWNLGSASRSSRKVFKNQLNILTHELKESEKYASFCNAHLQKENVIEKRVCFSKRPQKKTQNVKSSQISKLH